MKADHLSFFDASKNITYRYGDNDLVVNKALQDVCDVRQGLLKEIYESLGITQLSQDPVEFDLYNMEDDKEGPKEDSSVSFLDNILKYATLSADGLIGSGNSTAWAQAVQEMAAWYVANIHQYNQGRTIACPIVGNRMVRMDCSGFVTACLWRYGAFTDQAWPLSSRLITGDSATATKFQKAGFVKLTYTGTDILQPFDIMSYNGHVEIYAGLDGRTHKAYSWGRCHDVANGGLPCMMAHVRQGYDVIWRCQGGGLLSYDNSKLSKYYGGVVKLDDLMKALPKGAKREIAGAVLEALDKYGPICGLSDKGKIYLLAQMAHESAFFRTMEEYGSGARYEGNKNLGNTQRGDGPRFKGRGAIQVTGRWNYTYINKNIFPKFGIKVDIVNNPEAISKDYALGAAVSMAWLLIPGNGKKAIAAANAGNVLALTKAINGGTNGLQQRIDLTNKLIALAK